MPFCITFRNHVRRFPFIAVPNYASGINDYRLDIGNRLFEKYGWIVGKRDCSTILPLDQWEPEDREALIDLYQRANPECSRMDSPGWKSKHRPNGRYSLKKSRP